MPPAYWLVARAAGGERRNAAPSRPRCGRRDTTRARPAPEPASVGPGGRRPPARDPRRCHPTDVHTDAAPERAHGRVVPGLSDLSPACLVLGQPVSTDKNAAKRCFSQEKVATESLFCHKPER